MTVCIGICIGIIAMLLMSGYVIMDSLEYEKKKNNQYFTKLRKEYDIQIEQYKQDIKTRDAIIDSYRNSISTKGGN